MLEKKITDEQWMDIKAEYIAGVITVKDLAEKNHCSEVLIYRKAKKLRWKRQTAKTKAEKVKRRLAGDVEVTPDEVNSLIEQAIDEDLKDMKLGVDCSRLILEKVALMISRTLKPNELKALSETIRINIDVIRKIRGLDEKPDDAADLAAMSTEELKTELERLQSE